MAEIPVEVLPGQPCNWQPEDMWAWVNRSKPHVAGGHARVGMEMPILDSDGAMRPIFVCFDRLRLVESEGYTWDNHLADEMLHIAFLSDRILLKVTENLPDVLLARLVPMAGIARLADALRGNALVGEVPVSLGDSDWGRRCLAFSSQLERSWLIPDPYFFLTRAYAKEKAEISENWKGWDQRKPQIYWRGAPSGMQKYADHAFSQRVQLVLHSLESPRPASYNVRFASLNGIDEAVGERVRSVGGLGAPEPQMNILDYRYNLDVDGWSCAWTGLFIKLLAGSPVLKIESDMGFRQWYYDKLSPWRNFVPVARDIVDLDHSLGILEARPDVAEEIGAEGKAMAEGLSFESQFEAAALQMCDFAVSLASQSGF
ncbi:glycosyl transferase family 90 [Novosphingobium sp. EMRT-2]|uniref:glycosyl transferase family 90 n=1 Tax=Novosphingobium sp. EMRT-2 TaxID=2571749 RepID=UPI00143DF8BB|nr:glycosyl transferase family 90 [Novosphingobium sp. EMRT-2]